LPPSNSFPRTNRRFASLSLKLIPFFVRHRRIGLSLYLFLRRASSLTARRRTSSFLFLAEDTFHLLSAREFLSFQWPWDELSLFLFRYRSRCFPSSFRVSLFPNSHSRERFFFTVLKGEQKSFLSSSSFPSPAQVYAGLSGLFSRNHAWTPSFFFSHPDGVILSPPPLFLRLCSKRFFPSFACCLLPTDKVPSTDLEGPSTIFLPKGLSDVWGSALKQAVLFFLRRVPWRRTSLFCF